MRRSILRISLWIATFAIFALTLSTSTAAESMLQKIKRAALEQACRGGDQKSCQDLAKMNGQQPQSGQSQQGTGQQRPGQRPPRIAPGQPAGSAINDSGPFKPPAGTKIEETALAPVQENAKFEISPRGVHVATVEAEGSRAVVYYDGVEGPKFDQIISQDGNHSITFSPDGKRYAYCGRAGNQLVVMVDGKEVARSSESVDGHYEGNNCDLGFTQNSKHYYYRSWVNLGTERGKSFERFVFDGKPSPVGSVDKDSIAISPDGEHYAYNLTISDPYHQDRFEFAVDGKVMPYLAGGAQWTNDSKHLYTRRHVPNSGLTELLFDGRPLSRAFEFRVYIPPVGDMVVTAVTGGTNGHPFSFLVVNGKKVPGSDTVERGIIHDVVFSPDGKHYAVHCENLANGHYVIVDGKRGQEYSSIDKLTFTADSSTLVYMTFANGRNFIVVGDKEFGSTVGSVLPPVFSPVGNRVAAFINMNGRMNLLLDGKLSPLEGRGGGDLSFTPDGAHYVYLLNGSGLDTHLTIDGVVQPQSTVSNDRIDMANVQALKYAVSADSKHFAHFAYSNGENARGIFLDGKFIPTGNEGSNTKLVFSPDSTHLFWIHAYGDRPLRIFVDGKPLFDFYAAGSAMSNTSNWWDFSDDGKLMFLAQDDNSLKRITITLSDQTSLATLLGGKALAKNLQ